MFRRVKVVRQFLRRPRIPDHGGVGTGFLHANRPFEIFVADFHRAGRVGINAVGFLRDAQNGISFQFARAGSAGGEVIKRHILQPDDGNRADVADLKISVQAIFHLQALVRRFVRGDEFHRELVGDGNDEFRAQRRPFGRHGVFGQSQANRHRAVWRGGSFGQIPGRMRAKPCAGSPSRGPNHGKQIGTPPRIGRPAANWLTGS